MFGMLARPDPLGALTPFGPGMQVVDMVRLHVFHDFSALLDPAALCAFQPDRQAFAVIAEIAIMWLSMVLAMVLPSWACGGALARAWPKTNARFRMGICAGLLCLCGAGALVQILAQGLGVLSPQLRVTSAPVQAIFLCASVLFFGLRRLERDPDSAVTAKGFSGGFRWMIRRLLRCVPMLLLMFPLGLMNVLAMLVVLAVMALSQKSRSRPASARTGSATVT